MAICRTTQRMLSLDCSAKAATSRSSAPQDLTSRMATSPWAARLTACPTCSWPLPAALFTAW